MITIGIVNQMSVKPCSALCRAAQLLPLYTVIAPCIIFHRKLKQFTLLALRLCGFTPILRSVSLEDVIGPFSGPDRVNLTRMAEQVDKPVHFTTSCMYYSKCCTRQLKSMPCKSEAQTGVNGP